MNTPIVLAARAVSKRFPGTLALNRVDFAVRAGQVHALVGENGAGKSTLMRILSGIEQPTAGTVELDGQPVRLLSARGASARGIAIIHQELNLLPNLTVAENIFLAREKTRWGAIDSRAQDRVTRELMARLEQRIAPGALAGDLSLGQQQIVEIARAIAQDVRVLIMDEPASALSRAEVAVLFRIIGDLRSRGVGVVYISHRLEELLAIADSITVLRDGSVVAAAKVGAVDVAWIVERMTGAGCDRKAPRRVSADPEGTPAKVPAPRGAGSQPGHPLGPPTLVWALGPVSFSVSPGEIVGLYGLLGAGRTELFESLMGLRPSPRTDVQLDGRPLGRLSTAGRIRAGLALVPADRQGEAIVPALSVRENMLLAATRGLYFSPAAERLIASGMLRQLDIRTPGLESPITALSGGNQQKVVLARYLLTSPKVLLLDEPTRGVDVGARAGIYAVIRRLAAEGMAVLFASSELQEVLALSARILVMAGGRITREFGAAATEDELVAAAAPAAFCEAPAPWAGMPALPPGTPVPPAGTPAPPDAHAPPAGTPVPPPATPAPPPATSAPRAGMPAPGPGTTAPPAGTPAPRPGTAPPRSGTTALRPGTPAPPAGMPPPWSGTRALPAGTPAPRSGTAPPRSGATALRPGTPVPPAGTPAPPPPNGGDSAYRRS
ncbi:MAG: sugar ABC transporter ATP-binding protein [Bryobacteraceae bacterium]